MDENKKTKEEYRNNKIKKSQKVVKIRKRKVAEFYALWQSIPSILKIIHRKPGGVEKIKDMGFDTDNTTFVKLLGIKTQTEFSKEFDISERQLNRWNKSKKMQEMVDNLNIDRNIINFKKDIDFTFTRKTIQEADGARVKLWKQLYEGWTEKAEVENKSDALSRLLDEILNANKSLIKPESADPRRGTGYKSCYSYKRKEDPT